jgi:hypothetical protein
MIPFYLTMDGVNCRSKNIVRVKPDSWLCLLLVERTQENLVSSLSNQHHRFPQRAVDCIFCSLLLRIRVCDVYEDFFTSKQCVAFLHDKNVRLAPLIMSAARRHHIKDAAPSIHAVQIRDVLIVLHTLLLQNLTKNPVCPVIRVYQRLKDTRHLSHQRRQERSHRQMCR